MARVIGIDHLSLSVGDFDRSKAFYAKLLDFLGFELEWEFGHVAGWNNGHTMLWIQEAEGEKHPHRFGRALTPRTVMANRRPG